MYNDYTSEREIYNEETYSLFSHRADIKAKRNYITTQPKRKEVDTSSIEVFLFGIGFFCMAVAVMLV